MALTCFSLGLLLTFGSFLRLSEASFNLYLKKDEMMKVFGLSKELYYVREGVLNEYALNFVVVVPDQVKELHFTWETLGQKPLPYSSSIEISDSLGMDKPTLNISSKGLIPAQPETFRVSLPCTGIRDSEVNVDLILNVTTYPKFKANDVTRIVLKRKKICLADPKLKSGQRGHPPGQKPRTKNQKLQEKEEDLVMIPTEEAVADNAGIIYIIVGCSLGLVIILVALASAAYVRTKKGRITAESNGFLHVDTSGNCSSGSGCGSGTGTGTGCSGSAGGSIFVRSESPHHYSTVSPCPASGSYTYSSFQPNIAHYSEISPPSSIETNSCKLAEMTIQRCKVRLQSVIMEGTFAKIYKGTVLEKDGSEERAVIKTVSDHSSPVQMALLLHEGLAFVGFVHKHVYSVVGVAAEERVPPFVIYPDDGFRNLKRFLQRCRSGPGRPITAQEIVHMAIQIASGIAFLHRQNVFHRDVAARNCVVDDKLMVKVSDSALSRDLFPDDYHWMGEADCESRPIKWMPPEAIPVFHRGSASADMWSFGVLLWELATLAQQPYAEMHYVDFVSFLKMGYRLSQPINCPDELYSSMTRCWTWDPDDRPKWTHVLPELQSLHAQLAQYV
ncbi:unnamed protein product [Allacma fusca]|uniref:Uncharacterized protein n=1 Tax=Allacma fusca TaxID=39272 RepID=A0A8J2KQH7_9HEXA|nr:unnamed protein product [Allacma fusca]